MTELHGNTSGLSPHAHKLLERIYRRRVPLAHIATPELMRSLAEGSRETGRQVGVLVHRSGHIDSVIVGDATKLMLPDIGRLRAAEGRFRGLRLVHTHLFGEELTRDDFVDLVRLRLDLVAALLLDAGSDVRAVHYAYNTPPRESGTDTVTLGASPTRFVRPTGRVRPEPRDETDADADAAANEPAEATAPARADADVEDYEEPVQGLYAADEPPPARRAPTGVNSMKRGAVAAAKAAPARPAPYIAIGPVPLAKLHVDFGGLIASLEDEFAKRRRLRATTAKDGRAILVHVADKSQYGAAVQAEESLRELSELARTAGVEVTDVVLQVRDRVDPRLVLGRGKLDDVVLRAAELDAATLVFDRDLTPSQASAISRHSDLKVIDRTQLILDIFAQRAESADGKLQVELAQLKYALPRLGQKDDSLSRLTGGIGGRGPGETKLEIGRRRAKERVSFLEDRLEKLGKRREVRRRRRSRLGVPVVSIVGYTNAGKSTLLNALTQADVLAENKLFATLDPRSRRLRFPEEREVVLTDTVGFIRSLPRELFAAFRATFEEAADADLLLHVVDASDAARAHHVSTTDEILTELELDHVPRVIVWNKIDALDEKELRLLKATHRGDLFVSATDPASLAPLLDRIASELRERWAASLPGAPPASRAGEASGELEELDDELGGLDDERHDGKRKADRAELDDDPRVFDFQRIDA